MLQIVAGALGRNVAVDDNLPDEPKIAVASRLDVSSAIDLLYSALAAAGYEMSFDDTAIHVRKNASVRGIKANHHLVKAIRLNFIDASTFLDLAGNLIPRDRLVLTSGDPSLIIYVGPASGTGTLRDLRSLLDVYELRNTSATLIPLRVGSPEVIAHLVSQTIGGGSQAFPKILPLRRNRALLVIAPRGFELSDVRRLIASLDRLTPDDASPVRSITPKHRTAEEILQTLRSLVSSAGGPGSKGNGTDNPDLSKLFDTTRKGILGQASTVTQPDPGAGLRGGLDPNGASLATPTDDRTDAIGEGSDNSSSSASNQDDKGDSLSGLRRLVAAATADRSTNRILFSGTAGEFAILKRAVETLDQNGGQILIEAVVLQIGLTDELQYGVQYALNNAKILGTPVSGGLNAADTATSGLILSLGGSAFQTIIHALDNVTNVSVISSPKILVASGDTARFQFGADVPVLHSVLTTSAGQGAAIANQIDYRDTGVSLVVTASAIDQQIADLSIKQSLSDVSSATVAGVTSPVFDQRKIDTHVRMRFGDTLMLGGIIEHERNDSDNGTPVLNRIPLLGALFGNRTRSGARSEYVLLLRPQLYSVTSSQPGLEDATSLRFDRIREAWDALHYRDAFPAASIRRPGPLRRP